MKLIVTADIPPDVRQELHDGWQPLGSLEQAGEVFLKSAEPPSFIQIMADALQWLSPLKVAATIFLSQLAKEAATDIYKNKQQIGRALANAAAAPLRLAAAALKRARESSLRPPGLVVGLPIPDDYFGTALWLPGDSEEDIAWLVARFVVRAQIIEQLIQAEISAGRLPLGRVQVIPTDTGGFLLRWVDQEFGQHEHEVP
jgi:hypothetical protein